SEIRTGFTESTNWVAGRTGRWAEIAAFASSQLEEIPLATMKAARKPGEREIPCLQWIRMCLPLSVCSWSQTTASLVCRGERTPMSAAGIHLYDLPGCSADWSRPGGR